MFFHINILLYNTAIKVTIVIFGYILIGKAKVFWTSWSEKSRSSI